VGAGQRVTNADDVGAEQRLTNADLDVCHGRISSVPWDGRLVLIYHCVATDAFPYTVSSCFRGTGSGRAWDNH
jgi:hypothetical protein